MYLMLTAVLWGASFVGTRFVIDAVPPLTLGFARAFLGVLLLLAITRFSGQSLSVPGATWRWLALLGLLGIAYFYIAINLALQWTTATTASLLTLPYPVMTALGARFFLGESIGPRRAAGIAIALVGALTLTLATAQDSVGGSWLGNLLAFSTTVAWTAYTLVGREVLPSLSPLAATAHLLLAGSMALLPLAALELASGAPLRFTSESVAVTAFLGLACTGIAYLTWNRGLALLGATRASVYLYVQPLAVILLAVPLLGEQLTVPIVVGGLVIVLGTWLVLRPERPPRESGLPIQPEKQA